MSHPVTEESGLAVGVQLACPADEVPAERLLSRWADAAYRTISTVPAEIALRIVSRDEMRELNHEYRGLDRPTNVLSFTIDSPAEAAPRILGDVVICRDIVIDEAHEQGKQPDAHWAHMTVHGVLHLCGYDHELDADAREMEALETEILVKLGFRNPW
jgi:probable rRNA maturation factor